MAQVPPPPPLAPPGPTSPRERLAAAFARLRRWAPVASLAFGVFGAAMMDRGPERAGLVAAASAGGWAVLAILALLERPTPGELGRRRAMALRFARFSSAAASSWAMQLAVFFSLPFYIRASALALHWAFVAAVAAVGAATLWDPFFQRLLARPWSGLALQAVASFAGLGAVLPILGFSNRTSLWAAAGFTALALPAVRAARPGARAPEIARAAAVALALPAALWLGAARTVPAAPLRLAGAAMGTRLADRLAVDPPEEARACPAQLVCSSSIAAPRGLKDALFHVWLKDGRAVDRIPLVVEGGQGAGYRTYSIKRNLGPEPQGRWTCAVQTASGQLLGEREAIVPRLPGLPAGPALGGAAPEGLPLDRRGAD